MFPTNFCGGLYLLVTCIFLMKLGVWLLSYRSIMKFIHKRNKRILVYSLTGQLEHKRIVACGHMYLVKPTSHVYETWYSALPLGEVDSASFPKTRVHCERYKLSRKFSAPWQFFQAFSDQVVKVKWQQMSRAFRYSSFGKRTRFSTLHICIVKNKKR
jgi:hypothetical protein